MCPQKMSNRVKLGGRGQMTIKFFFRFLLFGSKLGCILNIRQKVHGWGGMGCVPLSCHTKLVLKLSRDVTFVTVTAASATGQTLNISS